MADLVTQAALLADVDAKVTTNGANENTGARVNTNLHNIVDTLWNHAGIAGVDVGTCLFVNATTGDNDTGVRGRLDLQFETIDGALAASGFAAGDTIVIFDSDNHAISSPIVLNTNIYAPNAVLTGSPLKLAVDNVSLKIWCGSFSNGVISEDGSATPTTGTRFTIYGTCYADIEAAYVFLYDGFLDGDVTIPDGGTCALQRYYIGNGITGGDGSFVELRISSVLGDISVGDLSGCSVYASQVHKIYASSGTINLSIRGAVIEIPPDPATVDITNYGTVGLSPLLTASFNYIGPTGDPGTARWGVDDGTFADITKVRLSTTDYNGNDIADYLDAQTSGQLELRTLDYSKRILFTVTGVSGTGTYRTFDVTPVLGSFPINYEFYTFDFREAGVAPTPQTLAETLIEGQETSGRSIIISEFDGINFEQGVNQVRLKAPATATGSRAQTLQDKDGEIALTSDIPLIDSIGGLVEVAADTTYRLGGPSAFAYTIHSLDVETDSGTITVAVKINGTPVTGLSAVAASSTPASATATAANTVAVGDYLTFVTSANSAAEGLLFGITITRTP